jgi:hypothetical protein
VEFPPVSRADLIQTYISALPFAPVAIVAIPGDSRCRVETAAAAPGAPGEKTIARYYFKPSHIELLLGAAAIPAGVEISIPPDAVAALIERTAKRVHAPYDTEPELRKAAEAQVELIIGRIRTSNEAGGLKQINQQYKRYRQAQIAKAERALPYAKYIAPFVTQMVRNVAMTGRMV